MKFTSEQLISRIKSELGSGKIKLEITDSQIKNAIEKSLDDYISIFGISLYKTLTVVVGQTVYDLTSWELDDVTIVNGISDEDVNLDYTMGGVFYQYPYLPTRNFIDFALDYNNWKKNLKAARQLLNSDLDWKFDPLSKVLYLSAPSDLSSVMVEYTKDLDVEERLNIVKLVHFSYFFNLCVAYTKKTLGLVRRKYGTIPIPGGEITLDGDNLVTEGQEEIDKNKEDLISMIDDTIVFG